MNAQTQIHNLIESYRQAVIGKDVEKVMALYADDIVSFDAVKALQFKGKAAYRAHWQECMEMCPGPHIFEFHEINVVPSQEIAFAHWLAHCGGTNEKAGSGALADRPRTLVGSIRHGQRRGAVQPGTLMVGLFIGKQRQSANRQP
jgi:ketosteroid isomerase-like protein